MFFIFKYLKNCTLKSYTLSLTLGSLDGHSFPFFTRGKLVTVLIPQPHPLKNHRQCGLSQTSDNAKLASKILILILGILVSFLNVFISRSHLSLLMASTLCTSFMISQSKSSLKKYLDSSMSSKKNKP
jgi:hypothetical protein